MVYSNSCEEHKYLAGIRREKDAFERLIKERGVSVAFRLGSLFIDVNFLSRCCFHYLRSEMIAQVTR